VSAPAITVATGTLAFPGRGFWEAVAARGVDIEVVGMTPPDTRRERLSLAEHFTEVRVPMRWGHANLVERWLEREGATGDLAVALHHRHTPEYGEELERSGARAAVMVAAGSLAAPALLRHTRAPLIVDARGIEPALTPSSGELPQTATRIERRACRAASVVRAYSVRHAATLTTRYELAAHRILTVPDGVPPGIRFVPFDLRRARAATFGLDRAPIVLAPALARPHPPAVSERLDELERELPGVRVIRDAGSSEWPALLGVANAGIVLDAGPGPQGDVVVLAQAGVPILAQAGPLEDAGMEPGMHASAITSPGGLADAVLAALADDHTRRVRLAHDAVCSYGEADAADRFLADSHVADLLQWSRPMVRRPRPRAVSRSS
jgi:hypothetical protein